MDISRSNQANKIWFCTRIIVYLSVGALLFFGLMRRNQPLNIIKYPVSVTRLAINSIYDDIANEAQRQPDWLDLAWSNFGTNVTKVKTLNHDLFHDRFPPLPQSAVMTGRPDQFCDGFGNPLLFRILRRTNGPVLNSTFVIWSAGPNGINEWGDGDDLQYPPNAPQRP
jgi:hypothetical protein